MWWRTSNCSSLLIYRPLEDERLSWPGWLTYSGRLTHISGHPSATGRAQDGERTLARDRRSTTEPRRPTLLSLAQHTPLIHLRHMALYRCVFIDRLIDWKNTWKHRSDKASSGIKVSWTAVEADRYEWTNWFSFHIAVWTRFNSCVYSVIIHSIGGNLHSRVISARAIIENKWFRFMEHRV